VAYAASRGFLAIARFSAIMLSNVFGVVFLFVMVELISCRYVYLCIRHLAASVEVTQYNTVISSFINNIHTAENHYVVFGDVSSHDMLLQHMHKTKRLLPQH